MKRALVLLMLFGALLACAGAAQATLIQEDFEGDNCPLGWGVPTDWLEGLGGPGTTWEIRDLDGNRVLKGVSGPAVGGDSGISGPDSDNGTGWFVENFDMQVSLMIESGSGGGIGIGQGVPYVGNAYYVEVSVPRSGYPNCKIGLYETGLRPSTSGYLLGKVDLPAGTIVCGPWYDLRMVCTGTTFQVWFRPKSNAPWQDSEKIIEVPQDSLHLGHKSYVEGWAACWTQHWPSTVFFDDFRLEAMPFPAAETFSDDFEDDVFSLANWSQHWSALAFPTVDGSQVARITTDLRNGGIALGQDKQYYSHNFILRTSMYVDESFCGGVGWAWEGTETTDTDYHIEIERHPPGSVPAIVDDNFDDGALDPSRWRSITSSSATVEEQDGRLIVSITPDQSDEIMVGAVSSTSCLSGSFDVQVDFQLLNWPFPNGFAMGLFVSDDPPSINPTFPYSWVGRASTAEGEGYVAQFETPNHTMSRDVVGVTSTWDRSGTLRFVRTVDAGGARLEAYRWNASSSAWVSMASDTVPSLDAYIAFVVARSGSGFQGSGVTVAFDNFRVNSGTAVPIANPEVITVTSGEEQNSTSSEDEIRYGTYTEVAQPDVYWYTLEVTADYNNYYVWWWKSADPKPTNPVLTIPQAVEHPGYRLANLGAVGLWQKPGRSGCFDGFLFHGTPAPSVNTFEGSNVLVQPENVPEMAITFGTVATDGTTSVEVSTTAPDGGSGGLQFQELYYDINTTCVFSGPVQIELSYDDPGMTLQQEESLRLMHWLTADQRWEDITVLPVDTANNVVRGVTDSLSVFALAILNLPPTASFSAPSQADNVTPVIFVNTSTDPDGTIVSNAWDFGDGATSSQYSPQHRYTVEGVYTVTLTVTDDDGATDSKSAQITVRPAYTFDGFLPPINMPPAAMSVFKQKSTIPVKFRLLDPATGAPVPGVVATIWGVQVSLGVPSAVNEAFISTQPDGGDTFRYDPTAGQYIYNLSTKSLSPGVYRIHADIMGGLMDRWVDVAVK